MSRIEIIHDEILDAASANAGARIDALRVGQFWSVVSDERGAREMASTLRSESHFHGQQPIADAGRLERLAATEIAHRLKSASRRRSPRSVSPPQTR